MKDCFEKNEAPFVSHLLYTQEGVLDDNVAEERGIGMEAGFLWGDKSEKTVVYTDLGISSGMRDGILRAVKVGRKIEYRSLPEWAINDDFISSYREEMEKNYKLRNRGDNDDNYGVSLDPLDKMATIFHNYTLGENYSNLTHRDVSVIEGIGQSMKIAVSYLPGLIFNGNSYSVKSQKFMDGDFKKMFGFDFYGFTRKVLTEKMINISKMKPEFIIYNYMFSPTMDGIVIRYARVDEPYIYNQGFPNILE